LKTIPHVTNDVLDLSQWSFKGRTPNNPYMKGNLLLAIAIRSKESHILDVNFPQEISDLKNKLRFYGVVQRQAPAGFLPDDQLPGPAHSAVVGKELMGEGMPPFMGGITTPTIKPIDDAPPTLIPAQEKAEKPDTPPPSEAKVHVQVPPNAASIGSDGNFQLDDDDFPTNPFIKHFFMISNIDIDKTAGYYDESAQFSITVSSTDFLSEYTPYARNLCEGDSNLLIGQDSVEGLKMIVADRRAFEITSVLNSEIIEGFFSVVVSGVVTLKSSKEAYFDRTLVIVDAGESYVIASDQLHISPIERL